MTKVNNVHLESMKILYVLKVLNKSFYTPYNTRTDDQELRISACYASRA